jgi:hypothetical protein
LRDVSESMAITTYTNFYNTFGIFFY